MHRRKALLGMPKAETLLMQHITYTSYTRYFSAGCKPPNHPMQTASNQSHHHQNIGENDSVWIGSPRFKHTTNGDAFCGILAEVWRDWCVWSILSDLLKYWEFSPKLLLNRCGMGDCTRSFSFFWLQIVFIVDAGNQSKSNIFNGRCEYNVKKHCNNFVIMWKLIA